MSNVVKTIRTVTEGATLETVDPIWRDCARCKHAGHAFRSSVFRLVCKHPDAGPTGIALAELYDGILGSSNVPAAHCGDDRHKFEYDPNLPF